MWPETEAEAIALQLRLAPEVIRAEPDGFAPRTVAGLDVDYREDRVAAAVVVLDADSLTEIESDNGETVGAALRTQRGVKPVFVSVGHRISLERACAEVLRLAPKYRQPETTRRADRLCRDA